MAEAPEKFLLYNTQSTKTLNIVVEIEGVPGLLTSVPLYRRALYGDPGLYYGKPGLIYGGIDQISEWNGGKVRPVLSLDASSLTLQQRIEPEQGRASISQLVLGFIDKDGYLTELCSPGMVVDDILGKKLKVYLGYPQVAFPEDYYVIFRGIITQIDQPPGLCRFTLSDANLKRRSQVFFSGNTKLSDNLGAGEFSLFSIETNSITFPAGINAAEVYDLDVGDTCFISSSAIPGNNGALQVTGFAAFGGTDNRRVLVDKVLTPEATTAAKVTPKSNHLSTLVNCVALGDFFESIFGPDGSYDPGVKLYLKIDDEFIEYGPSASLPSSSRLGNSLQSVVRGARGTIPAFHDTTADVSACIELTDSAIDLALKIMLSGWNGPCLENLEIASINKTGTTPDVISNAVILPKFTDAKTAYGLTIGDYCTISGSSVPANNLTFKIIGFQDLDGQTNRAILSDTPLSNEVVTTGKLSVRSKYDTLPILCGTRLTTDDVDVERHEEIKATFLGVVGDNYRFFITGPETAKTFIESEIYLPIACYSLSRFGRLSMGITKPPIADERLQFLTDDNVTNAPSLTAVRGLTNRKFFNQIDWSYDVTDDGSTYRTVIKTLDTTSLNVIGIGSVLPIKSKGIRTEFAPTSSIDRRTRFLLERYKQGAVVINPEVMFEVGIQIEAGDIVAVQDNGTLQIANYTTGKRDLGTQLFEVIDRAIDLKNGNVKLQLLSGVGGTAIDRFGTIAPSSKTKAGVDLGSVIIEDSYGAKFPGNEKAKWEDYEGQPIVIHNDDWSVSYERTLVGFDPANPYKMLITPALPSIIPAGFVVDVPAYPVSADVYVNQTYKAIHAFLDPTVTITSGGLLDRFSVALADISKFNAGAVLIIHAPDYTTLVDDVTVSSVDYSLGIVYISTLTVAPATGDLVELIGFNDKGAGYRYI